MYKGPIDTHVIRDLRKMCTESPEWPTSQINNEIDETRCGWPIVNVAAAAVDPRWGCSLICISIGSRWEGSRSCSRGGSSSSIPQQQHQLSTEACNNATRHWPISIPRQHQLDMWSDWSDRHWRGLVCIGPVGRHAGTTAALGGFPRWIANYLFSAAHVASASSSFGRRQSTRRTSAWRSGTNLPLYDDERNGMTGTGRVEARHCKLRASE